MGWRIWTMAIRCRAWLSLRLPARERRWRTTSPLEASIGAVPLWAAKRCLVAKRHVADLAQELGGQDRADAEQLDEGGR